MFVSKKSYFEAHGTDIIGISGMYAEDISCINVITSGISDYWIRLIQSFNHARNATIAFAQFLSAVLISGVYVAFVLWILALISGFATPWGGQAAIYMMCEGLNALSQSC